jgi:hypothetical protein
MIVARISRTLAVLVKILKCFPEKYSSVNSVAYSQDPPVDGHYYSVLPVIKKLLVLIKLVTRD